MYDLTPGSTLRKILIEEFLFPKHCEFRKWYFRTFSKKDLDYFKEEYFSHLKNTEEIIFFVNWFIPFYISRQEIQISTLQNTWNTAKGEIISSPFPPE